MSAPTCPGCGKPLHKVTQSPNSMLNAEQFDAARAGDWFCDTCKGGSARTGYRYFWNRDLITPVADMQPAPATEQASTDKEDKFLAYWTSIETDTRIALLVGARTDTEKLHSLLRTVYEAATQAERVQDRPLAMSNAEAAQWARANGLNVPPEWEGLAERVQSSGSIDTESERRAFEAQVIPAWSRETRIDSDGDRVYVEDWMQGAFIGWCLARRATASKAEAPEVKCVICGADEPRTGTCGSDDPRALCNSATAVACNAALRAAPASQHEAAPVVTDTQILDWLETHVVNVRVNLRYGSRDLFWASPTDEDGDPDGPSNIREQCRAAIAATTKQGTP